VLTLNIVGQLHVGKRYNSTRTNFLVETSSLSLAISDRLPWVTEVEVACLPISDAHVGNVTTPASKGTSLPVYELGRGRLEDAKKEIQL
jgi:hypothetical protein